MALKCRSVLTIALEGLTLVNKEHFAPGTKAALYHAHPKNL